MNTKKRKQIAHVNCSKKSCNTNKPIIVNFRVSVKDWKLLLRKAGGRGRVSHFIRKKLGFAD